jgi:hypothetical protein
MIKCLGGYLVLLLLRLLLDLVVGLDKWLSVDHQHLLLLSLLLSLR